MDETQMKFIRENELIKVYQCKNCGEYIKVPSESDTPRCECSNKEE